MPSLGGGASESSSICYLLPLVRSTAQIVRVCVCVCVCAQVCVCARVCMFACVRVCASVTESV